jgi:hypothetical protein
MRAATGYESVSDERKKGAHEMDVESTVDGSEDGRLRIPMEQLLEDMEGDVELGEDDD